MYLLFFFIVTILFTVSRKSFVSTSDTCVLSKQWTFISKGIFALLIIAHHIGTHLLPALPSEKVWIVDYYLWNQFYSFGGIIVGLFFFVSGYGLFASYAKKRGYLKSFLRKRVGKLLLPVLIITALQELFYTLAFTDYSFMTTLKSFLSTGDGLIQWFVCVLLILYVVYYICFTLFGRPKMQLATVLFVTIVMSLYFWLIGKHECWYISNICFPLGMYYGMYEYKIAETLSKHKNAVFGGVATIILLFAALFKFCGLATIDLTIPFFPVLLSMTSYFFTAPTNRIMMFLSSISFEMFLLNAPLIKGVAALNPPSYFSCPLLFVLDILLAYILHMLIERAYGMMNRIVA